MIDSRTVDAATCLGCGCACDDITLTVRGGTITDAERACALGRAWFGDGTVPWAVLQNGESVSLEAALGEAAELLAAAAGRVLVHLGIDWPCEAQRATLALADVLRATVDTATSASAAAGLVTAQRRGRVAATLGEIRNRADVLVFWGVDPTERYPRYLSRYAVDPAGTHVPLGRAERTVVSVNIGGERGPTGADVELTLAPADEIAALSVMRASLLGATLSPQPLALQAAVQLASLLAQSKYVVLVHDAEPSTEGHDPLRVEGLITLAEALNGPTRAALGSLRAGGNRSGAEAVLTWQTGYPFAVDYAEGFPRYSPRARGLDRVAGGDFSAVLIAGSTAGLSPEHSAALSKFPVIVIGPRASQAPFAPRLAIDTGVAGIHEPGLVYRMDDVPLLLRPPLSGPRTTIDILGALTQAVLARRRGGA